LFAVIRKAKVLQDLALEITWKDGEVSVVSLHETVAKGGVFEPLGDPEMFAKVELGEGGRWLQWPSEVDICADDLWYQAHPNKDRRTRTDRGIVFYNAAKARFPAFHGGA
jgi:hypothetical protein